jgi:hypothetical protein
MICPTRGRPENAVRLHEAFKATTGPEAAIVFAVDQDDPKRSAYVETGVPMVIGPRLRIGGTLNRLTADWRDRASIFAFGFLGDDHLVQTEGWSLRFLAELDRMGTGMVYGNDLIQGENLPTAIAMTTDIITALGYMVPGGLVHLEIDTAWKLLGQAIGRLTYLPDVVIEHMHPIAGKAPDDAGYREANDPAQYEADGQRLADWKRLQMPADVERLKHLIAAKENRP